MRSDMFHVIIDRPRTGGDGGKSKPPKGSKRKAAKVGFENLPNKESTARGRKYGWDCKQLNEHLSPLRRYLRTNVGRPWNKVFSEICENISQNSATQSHVRDHLKHYVETNAKIEDGKVVDSTGKPFFFSEFFVHPKTGLLCYNKEFNRPYGKPKTKIKPYIPGKNPNHHYRPINGIWYEVFLGVLPKDASWRGFIDVVLGDKNHSYWLHVSPYLLQKEYGISNVSAIKKRQLGKREVKTLKLWDTPLGQLCKKEMENGKLFEKY